MRPILGKSRCFPHVVLTLEYYLWVCQTRVKLGHSRETTEAEVGALWSLQ